ncbi:MAG: hypothetical protein HGA31_06695 [Candidatus Moranbacteria bacterium]|nr:hypothetical protein [Candidatus Moranbacteria bacterium]
MEKSVLFFLYVLSWVVHGTWVIWAQYLTKRFTPIKTEWKQFLFVIIVWIMIDIASAGCPFAYLHQYLELKMGWRTEITYNYQVSFVYKYLVRPVQAATDRHASEPTSPH